jgi:hypothetical protein
MVDVLVKQEQEKKKPGRRRKLSVQDSNMICGYACVSTDDQDTAAQERALKAAGAEVVFLECASGRRWKRLNSMSPQPKATCGVHSGEGPRKIQ